jgi:hypothetical protein
MRKHRQENWPDIFFDYYSGMSQRELIHIYDVPDRTIRDRCKYIINKMMINKKSIFRQQWPEIKKEIKNIVDENQNN